MPAPSSKIVEAVLRQVDAGLDQARENLFALLRIPSISAQPAHADDCRRAGEWVRDQLAGLGFTANLRDTAGHPVVIAHHPGPEGYRGPHVLFYGHYDVQPVDPVDAMEQPAVRPAARGWPARQAIRGPWCGGRQGPDDDVYRGLARLAPGGRWHSRADHDGNRRRGGGGQPQPGAVPGCQSRRAAHRSGADQRYRHVGYRHAGPDHPVARHGVHASDAAGGEPGPAFRAVRRLGAEPDQRALPRAQRAARRGRPHPGAWLL